jgi:uncharacterized protein YciI
MFLIELSYRAALTDIDANMAAHVAFLHKYYEAGHFLVSGRKVPRTGGVILAVGDNEQQIDAIVREDPFVAKGLADYRIVRFRASQRAADIQSRVERESRGAAPGPTKKPSTDH